MPTYDYRCQGCQHQFTTMHSIAADPLKDCPSCGQAQLKRLIGGGGGVLFKGGGFYQTDYPSASYSAGAKTDAGSCAPGGCGAPQCPSSN